MSAKNLLIIDDEVELLENLKYLLRPLASEVFTATNGIDGLNILEQNQIHCVICDIAMPGMNGVEVIKEIRAKNNLVPFIFYTAHGNYDLMMEAALYGAFDFLSKPAFEDLKNVVTRGLAEGFHRKKTGADSSELSPSEYSKILDELTRQLDEKE